MSKRCPKCEARGDVAVMDPASGTLDDPFAPIWKCRLCPHEMPRRVLNTKKKRERQERFDELVKKYDLDCAA